MVQGKKIFNADCFWSFLLFLALFLFLKVKVAQSCPTFCDPMDYTFYGILQARILEWVAFPFSRRSSQPRDWTQVFCIAGGFFNWLLKHKGSPRILEWVAYPFSSGSSWPRNQTGVSCIAGGFFTNWAIREALLPKFLAPAAYTASLSYSIKH